MTKTTSALFLAVALATTFPVGAQAEPEPAASGRLAVFINGEGRRAADLQLAVAEVGAINEQETPVPLRVDSATLDARGVRGKQLPLASGEIPPGSYRGLSLKLAVAATGATLDLRLSFDYRVVALESRTLIVRWDVERAADRTGEPLASAFSLTGGEQALRRLTLYVVDERSGQVVALNRDTDRVFATINVGARPRGIDVGSDGRRAYVANSGDDTLSVLDPATHRVVDTIAMKPGCEPEDVAVLMDGRSIAVSCPGLSSVVVIDALSNAYLGDVGLSRAPLRLAGGPDGRTVFATVPEGNEIVSLDAVRVEPIGRAVTEARPVDLVADPANERIFVTHDDAPIVSVVTFDLRSVDRLQVGTSSSGVAIDSEGRRLYLTGGEAGGVMLVGPQIGTIIRRWITPAAHFVALDPDGRKLFATGGSAGTLIVLDRIAGRAIGEIRIGQSAGNLVIVP